MPNANTIAMGTKLPSAAGGASSTSEFQFANSAGTRIYVPLPSNGELKNKMFRVRAAGRVTGGTTTNFTVTLYYGISSTIGSNTAIEASTARAVNSASGNWFIEATCMWDATSKIIQGFGRAMVNNLFDAEAALNNAPTGANPEGDTALGFTVTGTFSASHASNAAYLDQFQIEAV